MVYQDSDLLMIRNTFATWLNVYIFFLKMDDLTKVLVFLEMLVHDFLHKIISLIFVMSYITF